MKQPNIVVLCSDQHHPAMTGYRGHPSVRTPNLDALAADGTYFTQAYCNSPICTPSRMSFITGKYPHDVRSWFLYIPLDENEMTWARRLDRAGIESTMLGKLDLCGPYQDAGFTHHRIIERRKAWNPYPRNTPFLPRLDGYVRPDKRQHIEHAGIRAPAVTNGENGHNDRYGFYDHDRIVTDWALDYLNNRADERSDQPWALYVGLLFPHWPYCVPQEYFDLYDPDTVEMPHDAAFPNHTLHPALRHFQQGLGIDGITEPQVRCTIAAYSGMITAMDANIGRIINTLKQRDLYDDTYIIYISDHGESLGEHGLFYKQCSYQASVGVPAIIKGPGVPTGSFHEPVSLVDLYPTIMDMAGLECEPDRPGHSWLRLINGQEPPAPFVFSEFHGNFFKDSWYMIRAGDYKYTYYCNNRPTLYNLTDDPQEMTDLAGDAGHTTVIKDCERMLHCVLDPEETAWHAKQDLGLISTEGEDYTGSLTVTDVATGRARGDFPPEPDLV